MGVFSKYGDRFLAFKYGRKKLKPHRILIFRLGALTLKRSSLTFPTIFCQYFFTFEHLIFFIIFVSFCLLPAYISFMLESELLTVKQKSIEKQKSEIPPQNSPIETSPKKVEQSPKAIGRLNIQDSAGLYEQNRKLRRKLKELSSRLDDELQKAAQSKLKQLSQRIGHPASLQSQSLELQNAYKMIQRLQKTVKDYESKESYHVTLKRVMDLEGIIKKKEDEIEQLKIEIKTQRKIVKDKEKYIQELIENSKKLGNPTEDLETISKLKIKLKKIMEESESLRRKELEKHEKLVKAERKIAQLQQSDRSMPVQLQNNNLHKQLEECKSKYKEAVQRLERQNIYIGKLNEKLNQSSLEKAKKHKQEHQERKNYSVSLDQLPKIKTNIHRNEFVQQLHGKSKRY